MKAVVRLVLLVLLVAAPLMVVLQGVTRDVIVTEMLRAWWVVRIFIAILPQFPFWLLLLSLVLILATATLMTFRLPWRRAAPSLVEECEGQVQVLARRIARAKKGEYYRWHLARYLGTLALQVAAYQHQMPVDRVRQRYEVEGLDLPPEVRAYIREGQAPIHSLSTSSLMRLGGQLTARLWGAAPEVELERVVQHLEDELEVEHDHGTRWSI